MEDIFPHDKEVEGLNMANLNMNLSVQFYDKAAVKRHGLPIEAGRSPE